ncbi:hypothetical protein [Bdellovibrio svalbardensis]|uniref:Prepilin-type N-terminal cleavage/methylation domain-containing protein n=1 Tax=Bdellovibrio svalbardensis TaxID=2972972 RepID=A0ABT6DHV7_9BACT|nr:hypothetical protein [Bdellovibrio svalbardensis]MDG0816099.1 hypothetical protein [Bdellovibrio svalbardensis]
MSYRGKAFLKKDHLFHGGLGYAGFSMIEVLGAMAAAAVVVMGTMKMAGAISQSGVGAAISQQRTNLDQELTTIFDNPDNCTRALLGTVSTENTKVNLNSLGSMNSTKAVDLASTKTSDQVAILDRVSLKSITLTNISGDLGSGTYRAILSIIGNLKDSIKGSGLEQAGTGSFNINVPVYYTASGGVISSCLSTKSPYSNCLALKGFWNGVSCDFCSSLGGSRLADGTCSIFEKPLLPVVPPPAPLVVDDGSATMSVTTRSLYNGYTFQNLGVHKWCALTSYSYDGDGIGECTITGSVNGGWNIRIGDEGTKYPQLCYITCSDGGSTAITGATNNGAMCSYSGKSGIMIGGCCSTGTQFKIIFKGGGRGSGGRVGVANDIGCH